MNKANLLKILGTTGTVLGAAGSLASYNDIIPASLLPYAAGLFAVSAALHKIVDTVGDLLDDGQLNQSFKD